MCAVFLLPACLSPPRGLGVVLTFMCYNKNFHCSKMFAVKISLVNSKELFHLGSIGTGDLFYKTNWPPASYLRDNSSVVFFPLEFTFKEEKTCLCFPTALANTLPSSCAGAPGQGKETRSVGWEVLILKSQTRKKTRPPHHHPAPTRAETDTHGCNPGMNACTDTHTHTCTRRYARSKPPPRDVTWPGTLTNIQTHQAQTLPTSEPAGGTQEDRDAKRHIDPTWQSRWGTPEPSSLHAGRGQQAGGAQR